MKKTALKRGTKPLRKGIGGIPKGTILKKRSATSLLKEVEGREEQVEQNVFFLRIWKPLRDYQRVCYETGERLYPDENGFPYTTYFHHVLPKELYPQFRFSPWNIILVLPRIHSDYETFPKSCPKIYSLYIDFLSRVSTLEP